MHDPRDLEGVYEEIHDSIAASYMLGYVPAQRPEAFADWRTVSITVNRPGVIARTRAGYFAQ